MIRHPRLLLILILFANNGVWAEESVTSSTSTATNAGSPRDVPKPKPFAFITQVPADIRDYGRDTFRKQNIGTIAWLTAGTGLLLLCDQNLVDRAHHLGDKLGITHTQYQQTIARIADCRGNERN